MTLFIPKNKCFIVMLIASVVLLYSFIISGEVFAEPQDSENLEIIVRPNKKKNEPADVLFKNQLLKLVLDKTKQKYGDYVIKEYEKPIKQSRVVAFIKKGVLFKVVATMTSPTREQDLWPIRIPIYKGLFGHRIFIIRQEDQTKFQAIKTLDELKQLVAIQGHDWPDSDILEFNGFNVLRSSHYRGIFQMLRMKRGDYFPRGVHEPWTEVEKHRDKKLAVEKTLLVRYDAPFYFFVRYGDQELHDRIKEGLLMAIKDGSFDELFFNHSDIQKIFRLANIKARKIFRIENPSLSKKTPLEKKKWWYNVGDEDRYFSSH